jgi:hypothetical protein
MINHIDVSIFESPIVVPFAISRETKDTARVVIIRLADDNGHEGIGESSPFVSLTGDTAESAYAEALAIKSALLQRSFSAASACLGEIEQDSRRRSGRAIAALYR